MEIPDRFIDSIALEVQKSKGWIKFMGIVMIVAGALQAVTIVGIVAAWLPIWIGVILMQASKFAEQFVDMKDPDALHQMLAKLRMFFVVQGIMLIVALVGAVLVIIFYIIFGLAMIGMLSQSGSI